MNRSNSPAPLDQITRLSLASWALVAAQFLLTGAPVRAGLISVDISSEVNRNIRSYTNGGSYPVAPVQQTVNGIQFSLVPDGAIQNSLGVIQTPGGIINYDISTNVVGASAVYTLMNSAFGVSGVTIATIEFKGTGGADVTFNVTEGDNIRDHNQDGYENSASNLYGTASFGGGQVRLDAQQFILPSAFASNTLTDIIFSGTASSNDPNGEAFLAGVTVQTPSGAPEPASLTLGGLGALGLLAYAWRRRKAVTACPRAGLVRP